MAYNKAGCSWKKNLEEDGITRGDKSKQIFCVYEYEKRLQSKVDGK